MGLFNKLKRFTGLKNKYAVKEIKEHGKLRGAVLLNDEQGETA
jgi:pimeloyl-CoA synthetase